MLFLQQGKWTFGHLSYDLGCSFQGVKVDDERNVGFPQFFFFHPQTVIFIKDGQLHVEGDDADNVFNEIETSDHEILSTAFDLDIQSSLAKEQYLQKIEALRTHIQKGDCYEINFCQEFFAEGSEIDPVEAFYQLSQSSPNPFSAFYRLNDQYLICASPERFLVKKGAQIFSQPMKGTAKRYADTELRRTGKEGFISK